MTSPTILDDIQEQIIKNRASAAVYYDDSCFTYDNLEASSNRLAHYLKLHHVEHGDIVCFHMRRSFDVLVTMLAIWKVGAAYLSLDCDTPTTRLEEIINQAKPKCIVSEPALLNNLPQQFPLLTCQDIDYSTCDTVYHKNDDSNPQQAAYLIYTSGSTGQPKGVLVTHKNLENYVSWFNDHFHITNKDVFNFNSSPAFDFSITCIHPALAAGAKILITSETDILNIETYCNQLTKYQVTFAKWTPSYFKFLVSYAEKHHPDFSNLRYLMIAGEELLTTYVEKWLDLYPNHTIINEYGPTETTVGITTHTITKSNLNNQLKTVPIGSPVKNNNLYIVDTNNHLTKEGEIGELLIGGDSVSSGYYQAPELTNIRFIKNPFSTNDKILYRTGDLVKQLPDKSYLYVGRIDDQVKISGYRVEPSEIEHCLLQHNMINHACITSQQDDKDNKSLIAYLVLKDNYTFNETEIRQYLSQHLPQFMVPQYYYVVSNIPLTANGKVDYKALINQAKNGKK